MQRLLSQVLSQESVSSARLSKPRPRPLGCHVVVPQDTLMGGPCIYIYPEISGV
jgi:hypothetical protein